MDPLSCGAHSLKAVNVMVRSVTDVTTDLMEACEDCDVLVMGTRGHGLIKRCVPPPIDSPRCVLLRNASAAPRSENTSPSATARRCKGAATYHRCAGQCQGLCGNALFRGGGRGCGPHFPAFSAFFFAFSGQVP